MNYPDLYNCKIAVIGLGYVGLPLAMEFAERKTCSFSGNKISRKVVGYDRKLSRIRELKENLDKTAEKSSNDLRNKKNIIFTNNPKDIISCDVFIVAVPTPINENKQPDLEFLKSASLLIGQTLFLKKSAFVPIIIFESTVYPGATEEFCVPIIEKESGCKYKEDFLCAYSPERINPGDKTKRLSDIVKITSGCDETCSVWVDDFYKSIIDAGTFRTESIKVAEAAKVIENTQRDINIALVNELSIIFSKMNIDILDVLDAASTKWNFLNFRPGLVGGHCIGIDPYYLTWKTEQIGYKPEMILSGRKVNEKMTKIFLEKIINYLKLKKKVVKGTKMLIIGGTFKEDCPDVRNSKIIDFLIQALKEGFNLNIYDPIADFSNLDKSLKKYIINDLPLTQEYDVLVIGVVHSIFKKFLIKNYSKILNENGFAFDIKGILKKRNNIIRP